MLIYKKYNVNIYIIYIYINIYINKKNNKNYTKLFWKIFEYMKFL